MKIILLVLVLAVSVFAGNTNEDKDMDFTRATPGYYWRSTQPQFINPYNTYIKPGVKTQINELNLQNYHRSQAFYNQNRVIAAQGTPGPVIGNLYQMPVVKTTKNILPLVSIFRGSATVNKIDDLKEKSQRLTKALTKSSLMKKQTYAAPNLDSLGRQLPIVSTFKNTFYKIPKLRDAAPNTKPTVSPVASTNVQFRLPLGSERQPGGLPKQNMISKPSSFGAPVDMTHTESLPSKTPQDTANANKPFGISSDSYRNVKSTQMNGYFMKEATVSTPRPLSPTAMDRYTDLAPVQNHQTTINAIDTQKYAGSSTSNKYLRNIHLTDPTAIQNHNLDSSAYHVPVTSNTQRATDQVSTQNWNNQINPGTSNHYPTNTPAATEPAPVQKRNNNLYSDAMISNNYPKNTQAAITDQVPTQNLNTQIYSRYLTPNSFLMGTQEAAALAQSPNAKSLMDTQAPTVSVTNNPVPLNALDTPAYPRPFTPSGYSMHTQGVTDPALVQNPNNQIRPGSLTPSSYTMDTQAPTGSVQNTQTYHGTLASNRYPMDTQAPTGSVQNTQTYPGTLASNSYPIDTQVATGSVQNALTYPGTLASNSYPVDTQAPTGSVQNTQTYPGTLASNSYPMDTQAPTGSVPNTPLAPNALDKAAYPGDLTSINYLTNTQAATAQLPNSPTYPGTLTSNNYRSNHQATAEVQHQSSVYDPRMQTATSSPLNAEVGTMTDHMMSSGQQGTVAAHMNNLPNTREPAVTPNQQLSSTADVGSPTDTNVVVTRQTPDFITSFFNQLKNHFQQKDHYHVPSYTQKYY